MLFCLKISVKIPSRSPVMNPLIKRMGAMNLVFSPKRKKRAAASCARLFPKAPAKLIPNALTLFLKMSFTKIIMNADEKEPAAEKMNMYEKSVPVITPCEIILKRTTRKISFFLRTESESIIGRFVSPSLKKGSGFGIAYSTAERKRQRAEKKASSFVLSLTDF